MANSPDRTPTWTDRLDPPLEHLERLRHGHAVLEPCGVGWDAVVVAPLRRGLEALDAMELPADEGYAVIADYNREELITYVALGTAEALAHVRGVRVLPRHSWLLTPAGETGTLSAAWLSRPAARSARYVDAEALRDALLATDAERHDRADRIEHARAH
ncbi:hypothetical protein ACIPYQ_39735 [Streptomyces sp. NPDC090045]|uniref:hypothetical protein n=1 Tax=Streptomyces sp. NPDC090045 TaxID=3365927 RepID=UPI0037F57631